METRRAPARRVGRGGARQANQPGGPGLRAADVQLPDPKGMEAWGRKVSKEEKEAFLHLWRVVGHVNGFGRPDDRSMGRGCRAVRPDPREERRRDGAGPDSHRSGDGLPEVLPARQTRLQQTAPAALIIDQLGPEWARSIVRNPTSSRAQTAGARDRRTAQDRAEDVLLAAAPRAGPAAPGRPHRSRFDRERGGGAGRQLARLVSAAGRSTFRRPPRPGCWRGE